MNSDIPHHNQQQQNINSGLTRYRSAPSSYFSNLINTGMYGDQDLDPFFNPIVPRFVSNDEEFMKQEQLHTMYHNNNNNNKTSIVSSSTSAMDHPTNILRQSSSPAGFLDNGYPMEKLLSRIPENNGGFWDEYLNEFVEGDQISSSENKGKLVRRTRISERMRKLQDLVPNMDKQTSTADMLDLAVDYIKELQNQVEVDLLWSESLLFFDVDNTR
ncbi:hypothetical protein L1987_36340 [Smallanthus sonchifolius]|uniref:Uncharacterized protein n=1 Tax=Smallanthus sonchifolius TaxID=185202 RepID=A0ACB9HCX6_9ASTR|nr:hypothetical protein L1987_36340 [Smallanthus sonchifolius]